VDETAIDHLIEHGGYEPALGARPMRRAVERHCETAIARAILQGEVISGDEILLRAKDGKLEVIKERLASELDSVPTGDQGSLDPPGPR
jgi:ATP-dependent Clp protease ATP-binding subunit ClpA